MLVDVEVEHLEEILRGTLTDECSFSVFRAALYATGNTRG